MHKNMKRKLIIWCIVGILTFFLWYPCLIGLISLFGDLKYSGFIETCNMCIRSLRLMSSETGYSYEFINVVLFIIIEPLIIFITTFVAFVKNNKIKNVILLLLFLIELVLFNYICDYYIRCSNYYTMFLSNTNIF